MIKSVMALALAALIAPVAFAADNENAPTEKTVKSETTVSNDADGATTKMTKKKHVMKHGNRASVTKSKKTETTTPDADAPATEGSKE